MIPLPSTDRQTADWRDDLRHAFRDVGALLQWLGLTADQIPGDPDLDAGFPIRVPRSFAARMRLGDPHDPLLLQVLPTLAETLQRTGFTDDAVGEWTRTSPHGLVRKYHGRALLITTGACAVHCRYCFRRAFPYAEHHAGGHHTAGALADIAADDSIDEVILSGGDPLSLDDDRLATLVDSLGEIAHVRRLRIHTRTPVVLPSRVTDALCQTLAASKKPIIMVIHANHANELNTEVGLAMGRLSEVCHQLLNQAVLLRHVNDTVDSQVALAERLFDIGVLPYYLHLLDRVSGTAHFEVTEEDALRLMNRVHARLSGYLVPRLVREEKGMAGKTILAWSK